MLGSFLLARWQLAKTTRVELYRELLPPITERVKHAVANPTLDPLDLDQCLAPLHRGAVIAGRQDERHAVAIMTTANERDRLTSYQSVRAEGSSDAQLLREAELRLLQQLSDFQGYLAGKIR